MKKKILGVVLAISLLCTSLTPMFGCNKGGKNSSSSPADKTTACVHEWTEKTEKQPTCAENGVKKLTCGKCGATKTEKIPATGHTFPDKGTVTADPTCVEKGSEEYGCSVCGIKKSESIAPVGHNYDDGKITTEPGCFSNGVKTYTCATCGDTYTEPVAPVGHKDADYDGNCDLCNEFIGEKDIPATLPTLVDGPWTNPEGFSWWSYSLEKSCSEEIGKVFTLSDDTYSGKGQSISVNFANGSKATSEGGAYILHIGMKDLEKKAGYTLTFYAKATNDFTGNINKMLCNANFSKPDTVTGIYYTKSYGAEDLAGKGWKKVSISFNANHDAAHDNMCAFRIAFDVGLSGWKGSIVLSDFKVSNTEYVKRVEGAVGTKIEIGNAISQDGVWNAGPLYANDGATVTVDTAVEHEAGVKSYKFAFPGKVENQETFFNFGLPGLTAGKEYKLTYYVKTSDDFNGCINAIMANPNYDTAGEVTMKNFVATCANGNYNDNASYKNKGWVEMNISFIAAPKDGLCSARWQFNPNNWTGALYMSDFTVYEVISEVKEEKPTDKDPVITGEHAAGEIALPDELRESGEVWTSGPLCSSSTVVYVDETVEYAKGSKSIKVDLTKSHAGVEYVMILALPNLTEGKKYELTFYVQGSENYNARFTDVFANPNFTHMEDGAEVRTMLDMTVDGSALTTAEGLKGKGWTKVTVQFTAHPKDGNCSIRLQLRPGETDAGAMWLSYFVATEIAA